MYIEPNKGYWTGRIDSELDSSTFRFHQEVQMKSIKELDYEVCKDKTFGLLGFECDEGVRRNKGKVGAAEAPIEIKKALAKLPWPFHHNEQVLDIGNVFCEGNKLEKAQQELGEIVHQLIQKKIIPIIIGGGHETAYAHYLGVREAIGRDKSLGVINIDAHFDLRPYDEGPSSGTMFKQILDSDERSGYLCVGVQTHGNTKALFTTAHEYGCHYLREEDLALDKMGAAISKIDQFISQHDFVFLTLCMDVHSMSVAPGVSAPSPFGLYPHTIRTLIQHIVSQEKTVSFDISEVNPPLDEKRKTITLAAYYLAEVLTHFHVNNN